MADSNFTTPPFRLGGIERQGIHFRPAIYGDDSGLLLYRSFEYSELLLLMRPRGSVWHERFYLRDFVYSTLDAALGAL